MRPSSRCEPVAERRPLPVETGAQRVERHALHPRQHPGEVVVLVGRRGRQREAAVAAEDRGDAVLHRRARGRIPEQLRVVVGVQVDEARRERLPFCVNGFRCLVRRRHRPRRSARHCTPTSPWRAGAPVPSTISASRINRSSMASLLHCGRWPATRSSGSGWRNSSAALRWVIRAASSADSFGDVARDDLLRVGPRRVGVRVVALDEDALGPDRVQRAERATGRRSSRTRSCAAAPRSAAGRSSTPRPPGPNAECARTKSARSAEHRRPAEAALVEGDVQLREAHRDARPQPIRARDKGIDREQRRDGLERGVRCGDRRPLRGAGVQADDGAGLLARGEERIPHAGVQARAARTGRAARGSSPP